MPHIPADLQSVFDDNKDTVNFAVAWANNVRKIDEDRALAWTDRTVWNEHDLAGALFLRDRLDNAIRELSAAVQEKLAPYVAASDERFRAITVNDSGERMAQIADVTLPGRSWWWFRVPDAGPIVQDLARYS
jgi:hypothetical protein